MTLHSQIQQALGLPSDAVVVRRIGFGERPLITLIDSSFEDKNELKRQRDVRRRLQEAGVDPNRIGFIMTNTPAEEEALREDALEEPNEGRAEGP